MIIGGLEAHSFKSTYEVHQVVLRKIGNDPNDYSVKIIHVFGVNKRSMSILISTRFQKYTQHISYKQHVTLLFTRTYIQGIDDVVCLHRSRKNWETHVLSSVPISPFCSVSLCQIG